MENQNPQAHHVPFKNEVLINCTCYAFKKYSLSVSYGKVLFQVLGIKRLIKISMP